MSNFRPILMMWWDVTMSRHYNCQEEANVTDPMAMLTFTLDIVRCKCPFAQLGQTNLKGGQKLGLDLLRRHGWVFYFLGKYGD